MPRSTQISPARKKMGTSSEYASDRSQRRNASRLVTHPGTCADLYSLMTVTIAVGVAGAGTRRGEGLGTFETAELMAAPSAIGLQITVPSSTTAPLGMHTIPS